MSFSTESITCELTENDTVVYLRYAFIGTINFFNLIIAYGMYFSAVQVGDATCEESLTFFIVIISAVLILSSLISFVCLCFKGYPKWLFWLYMMVLSVAILLFLIVIVFLFVFTTDSDWLRKMFPDDDNKWNKIKTCLTYRHICKEVYTIYGTTPTHDEFRVMRISYIQSGCCKPPDECNFEYVSPVQWIKPASLVNSTNPDCQLWRNDASAFCFDCNSCKDGFIHGLMDNWEIEPYRYICMLFVLLFYYCGGCGTLLVCWPPEKEDPSTPSLML